MPLRTPRRRISPRTKRRYRAIRNFFRKTLGSTTTQSDIKINSSIAINVTDLKHKIVGIEHQLDEVSKHCRDLTSFENISRRDTESLLDQNEISSSKLERDSFDDRKQVVNETKVLYKSSDSNNRGSDDSNSVPKLYNDPSDRDQRSADEMNYHTYASDQNVPKIKSKKSFSKRDLVNKNSEVQNTSSRKRRTRAECVNSGFCECSYHSLAMPRASRHQAPDYLTQKRDRKQAWQENHAQSLVRDEFKPVRNKEKAKRHKSVSPARPQENERGKGKKNKPGNKELDQDFIADIIKRQYKPVKFFGRRESDLSQMSSPVCRDKEYTTDITLDDGDLCSCLHDRYPTRYYRTCANELSDMHSLCDTRLYNARRRARSKRRRQYLDIYNDSDLYDVIPVKEKSSPKSRRKFVEDNMLHYDHFREVPPSPRSHRPRLNLRAQNYDEYEDFPMRTKNTRRRHSPYQQRRPQCIDTFRSDVSSEEYDVNKHNEVHPKLVTQKKNVEVQEDMGTMSSLQYPTFANGKTNTALNTSLNNADSNIDKTDKALSEIKDILQCFLQEIKKESTASQCDKSSDATDKTDAKRLEQFQRDGTKESTTATQNSGHNGINGFGVGQCSMPSMPPPYLPGFTNPCCYPMMPICPMNCMQNGYIVPSNSFTCQTCANQKETDDRQNGYSSKHNNSSQANNTQNGNETENLIREIYKYVANNTNGINKESTEKDQMYGSRGNEHTEPRVLTSRSVGKSSNASKHDAKVGTLPLRCYSKSCEAIGSRLQSDAYCSRTGASYSDTILERLSYAATTQSTTASESSEPSAEYKKKPSKFANVLRSFGLLKKNKKNKKDVIEELSESESTIEVEVKPKHKHPFKQEVTNYMMHGQEYYQPPPVPSRERPHRPRHRSPPPYPDYGYCPCDSRAHAYSSHSPLNHEYGPYREGYYNSPPHCGGMHPQASAPPYPNPYEPHCSHNMQPQVPLCLKEIEVKSIGTQSERKMPFFRKFSQRVQSPARFARGDTQNVGIATQTSQNKPGFFNWKDLQAKAASTKFPDLEPFAFSLKAQKQLAEGDNKMRNAMVKKLFYKRNPFSPRNLIVRTLLGRDKSSWGVPPANMVQRPRMFF